MLRAAVRDLSRHPCHWPEGELAGTRERQVGDYHLTYVVRPDTGSDATAGSVTLLRVFGPWQLRPDAGQS
jgi:hypothetical protein